MHDAALAARAAWERGEAPAATVQYRPPATTPLDLETGAGRPNYCYGYSAQAVEVEVDVLTGVTRVTKIISAHDVGRAINRQQVEGQIEGCLAQALGYALTENFLVRDGKILTPYFSTYLLPTTLDMPTEIVPVILELADPNGPYGARGVAEMPLVPFAPCRRRRDLRRDRRLGQRPADDPRTHPRRHRRRPRTDHGRGRSKTLTATASRGHSPPHSGAFCVLPLKCRPGAEVRSARQVGRARPRAVLVTREWCSIQGRNAGDKMSPDIKRSS